MATTTVSASLRRRVPTVDVYNNFFGTVRRIGQDRIPVLNDAFTKFGIRFQIVTNADGLNVVQAKGVLVNGRDVAKRATTRIHIRDYQARLQQYAQAIADESKSLKSSKLVILSDESLKNFVAGVKSWPEVIEVGLPGETMETAQPKFVVPANAIMSVRFWPTIVEEQRNNGRDIYTIPRHATAGSAYEWGLTPPILFTFYPDRIKGEVFGHPHLYTGSGKLCNGTAKFEHGNPFQVVPMLRDWYLGHTVNDYAEHSWAELARQWWSANGKAFMESQGTQAKVLLAPSQRRKAEEVAPLPQSVIDRVLSAPTGKVREAATTQVRFVLTAKDHRCTICGLPGRVEMHEGRYRTKVCGCCAVSDSAFQLIHEPVAPLADYSRLATERLRNYGDVCTVPQCGDPFCKEPEHNTGLHGVAASYKIVNGTSLTSFATACGNHAGRILTLRDRAIQGQPLQVTPDERMYEEAQATQDPIELSYAELIQRMRVDLGWTATEGATVAVAE